MLRLKMAKTTMLNGRRVNLKHVREVSIRNGQAFLRSQKEVYLFHTGFILVLLASGDKLLVSTNQDLEKAFRLAFYRDEMLSELQFEDAGLTDQWDKVYVYLFDECGSCLMYVDRDALLHVGYCFKSVNSTLIDKVREEALTIAGLLDKNLLDHILASEENMDEDAEQLSLLKLGGSTWE